ncbi:MAG: hypothetical protein KGM47_03320 [Acidobacteriota bacterium]|nr:hypothetical protein [Acidobacteriota bacterium]
MARGEATRFRRQEDAQLRRFLKTMRLAAVLAAVTLALTAGGTADTITQTTAQGQKVVIQTDAIVIQNNSYAIVYKHFDLKQRRVVEDHFDQGSLPYEVVESSPEERERIVSLWRKFGYTVTVSTRAGKTIVVDDAYFDFFPGPGGLGAFLESVPPRTNLPLLLNNGGADQVDFDQIASIENKNGLLTVTLTNGKVESGKFLMPVKAPAVTHLCGLSSQYKPASSKVYDFSLPLSEIKEIRFQQNN